MRFGREVRIVRKDKIEQKLHDLVAPVLVRNGFELVDVEYRPGRNAVLRVFIDHEKGINLNDCSAASRSIADVLDTEDIIPTSYRLEVSSPGVERPLRRQEDFARFRGKDAKVVVNEPVQGKASFAGEIVDARDGKLMLRLPQGQEVQLDISGIRKANLMFRWPARR